jgi:hypothetical protein
MDINGIIALVVLILYFIVLQKVIWFLFWFSDTPLNKYEADEVKEKAATVMNVIQGGLYR